MANFSHMINAFSTTVFNVYITSIVNILIILFEIDRGYLFNHSFISWNNLIFSIWIWLIVSFIWLKKSLNFLWTKVGICNSSHSFSWFNILKYLIFITSFSADNKQTFLHVLTFKILNINEVIALLILLIRCLRTIIYFIFFVFLV
jgi:hypothetical protein